VRLERLQSHNPAEFSRLVIGCDPCPCSKRPEGDGGIGIVRPIGLRPQLRRIVQLVIRDPEFRPWQGDDDVVALHFDVEVGFIRHLVDTNAKAEWRLLHAITSRGAATNPCVAEPLPLEGFGRHPNAFKRVTAMTHNIGEMERFFAELDGLLEAEIKARLAVGSWDDEKRSWAQLYLDEKASKRQRAAQSEMLEAARAAKTRSTIALVVAVVSAVLSLLAILLKV
jgi:hypothetical protein